MSRVDELKQRLAAIGDIKKHQFTGTPFVKSNDDLTKMKTTHFLELAADKLGKPNTGSITGLADAHSNPSYDSKYFKGLERGDELGVVEQKKQNIRHKGKSGVPMLINWKGKNQITGHEGRHLGRALLEEGFDEIPVEFTEGFMNTDPAKKYKNTKNLIRQNKNKMPNLKDTRAPIFGRKAKLKQRLAAIKQAGRWSFTEDNPDDKIPAKDVDKKYGTRGTTQEIDEELQELTYMLSDKGLGVRQSPLEHDFEANIHNTDSKGSRIQDTESMQGPLRNKGMISYSNAVKWSKLKQRLSRLQQ